jgi:adenylate kinase
VSGLLEVTFSVIALIRILSGDSFLEEKWKMDCMLTMGGYVKMAKSGMEFLKEKRYGQFIQDGQLVAPANAILLFCRVWDRLIEKGNKIVSPKEIVWINGAPGSGKGTNTRNVMRALNISLRPIVVSDLLNAEEFKMKIDQGLLVDDEEVTFLVFKRIFEEGAGKGIIVDGYPRTKVQVECVQLLLQQFKDTPPHMISINLLVDERTSIQRQLGRGEEAAKYNMKVRKTDSDPELAHLRYNKFLEETYPFLKSLRKFTTYYEIDTKGSPVEVRDRIYMTLAKKEL